jgi:AraC-like DNA-binding protein
MAIRSTSTIAGGDHCERNITRSMFPDSAATIAGMYRELPPPPDLAPLLACVWTSVAKGGRILPDGCVDVVWDGTDLAVAGPATIALDSPAVGTRVFGVRFRVGAAGAALGLPAEELADARVPVVDVWRDGETIREAAALHGLPGLIGALRARLLAAEADPLTRAAAVGLALPGARVADLGAELGISERQLRRRFADAVGYGPKPLARVLRFQRFLALAGEEAAAAGDGDRRVAAAGEDGAARDRRGAAAVAGYRWAPAPRVDLAGLAFAAGYADQAHLTRECRRLAGRTPAELVTLGVQPAGERRLWQA